MTWGTAFKYLQDGIAAAVLGDDIWVAQGTYRPDQSESNPGWLNDPNRSFNLKPDVRVFGGFPAEGGNGEFSARNPEVYITTLSGDIGVPGDADDNSLHVVTAQNIFNPTPQPKLNGFWIRYGNAGTGVGGGMRICGASPQIVRCTFDSNRAGNGGAIGSEAGGTCGGSLPVFVNCSFVSNEAVSDGGAMYVAGIRPLTGHNCVFDSNTAGGLGGAIRVACGFGAATVSLRNCTFTRNAATQGGGAIAWVGSSGCLPSEITNCIFWGDLPANNEIQVVDPLTAGITYSDVQGGGFGPTNIDEPPLFVDDAAGELPAVEQRLHRHGLSVHRRGR